MLRAYTWTGQHRQTGQQNANSPAQAPAQERLAFSLHAPKNKKSERKRVKSRFLATGAQSPNLFPENATLHFDIGKKMIKKENYETATRCTFPGLVLVQGGLRPESV